MTRLIGSNPVAVLATLLLMSYAKILKNLIQIFSYVNLEYPSNRVIVAWLKDANLPYLKGRHLILAFLASIIAVIFLPYIFLLLLGYKLYQCSNKTYISRLLTRIKPLLESHYAPYQKHTRYWTGLLIVVHCGLYIVFSYNSFGGADNSLLAITTAYTCLIVITWLSRNIYKNFYVNIVETLVFLNLIILSSATSNNANSPALVYSLVGTVFALMMGIILYQVYLIYISKSSVWLQIKLTLLFCLKPKKKPMANTEAGPLIPPNAGIVTTSVLKFRESLMEDYSSTMDS